MKPATPLILAVLALTAGTCGYQSPDDQKPQAESAPAQAASETFPTSELTKGDGAPGKAIIAEAVRVHLIEDDPTASARPSNEGDSIVVAGTAESIESARTFLATLAESDPAERIDPTMLYVRGRGTRDGIGKYFFDREIAHVMGHMAANWLERPSREKEERTSLLVDLLEVEPDTDVADIGAGTGYFTFPIAKRSPMGTTYAVDIQPEMLEFIEARKREEEVGNVTGVLGEIDDSKLPPDSIDLAFAVDAYHEFSHPWEMLQSIRTALRPGGRLILVEFRLEDPEVPIKLLHKMSEQQARRELEAAGFEWVKTVNDLPMQHVLVFRKPLPKQN